MVPLAVSFAISTIALAQPRTWNERALACIFELQKLNPDPRVNSPIYFNGTLTLFLRELHYGQGSAPALIALTSQGVQAFRVAKDSEQRVQFQLARSSIRVPPQRVFVQVAQSLMLGTRFAEVAFAQPTSGLAPGNYVQAPRWEMKEPELQAAVNLALTENIIELNERARASAHQRDEIRRARVSICGELGGKSVAEALWLRRQVKELKLALTDWNSRPRGRSLASDR